jgi:hypothetical protein
LHFLPLEPGFFVARNRCTAAAFREKFPTQINRENNSANKDIFSESRNSLARTGKRRLAKILLTNTIVAIPRVRAINLSCEKKGMILTGVGPYRIMVADA